MIALAAAALLAAGTLPDGFRATPIQKPMREIAAMPRAHVYCARSPAEWRAFLQPRTALRAYALTDIPRRTAYLGTHVCGTLERWLRTRDVPLTPLAEAVFVAGHESMHLRGIDNESLADCHAWHRLAAIARAFGIRGAATVRRMRALIAPQVPQCR